MVTNSAMNKARKNKKDEFYTRYDTVDREMTACADRLRGKRILCDCDDPFHSAFVWWFIDHFRDLGLARLEASCISLDGEPPRHLIITSVPEGMGGDAATEASIRPAMIRSLAALDGNDMDTLTGSGSFDSEKGLGMIDRCDIVATNPPFSKLRRFITTVSGRGRDYIVLGNEITISSQDLMPMLLDGRLYIGASIHKGSTTFNVPDDYPLYGQECSVGEDGRASISFSGIRWMTSMDYGVGTYPYDFNARWKGHEDLYPVFDNYDAINVRTTHLIPVDYPGIMGVPLTFIDRYDPGRFEIIGAAISVSHRLGLNRRIPLKDDSVSSSLAIMDGKNQFCRLFIINRRPVTD